MILEVQAAEISDQLDHYQPTLTSHIIWQLLKETMTKMIVGREGHV